MKILIFITLIAPIFMWACTGSETEEVDTIAPEISVPAPSPCSIWQFGSHIKLTVKVSDNVSLGSYKLNIHHNFDHHTHGNHEEVCDMDEIKSASNPFLANWTAELPEKKEYTIDTSFELPSDYEGGDYHALLYVTDADGNQGWTGVSIKIE